MGEKIIQRFAPFFILKRKFISNYNFGTNKPLVSSKSKNGMKGFTLIELVIVIAVLSVIIGISLASIDPIGQRQKAYDVRRKADLALVQKYLEEYYNDYGKYPASSGDKISVTGSPDWGDRWTPYGVLPKDPGSNSYAYEIDPTVGIQGYRLYASLERGEYDPQACTGGAACSGAPVSACGGPCNYVISSSNISPLN